MTLIRRHQGWPVVGDLQREINRLFDRNYTENEDSNVSTSSWLPPVDIKDEAKRYLVFADVPGVTSNDIDVHVDDKNRLVIKGDRHSETKESHEGYSRVERVSGSFYRAFTLPESIDADGITAKVKDGTLEVSIPKSERTSTRKITVEG